MFIYKPHRRKQPTTNYIIKKQPSLYDKDKNNDTGFNDTVPHH